MSIGNTNMGITKKTKSKGELPWLATVIICILFWPAGLYFLWKKIRGNTRASLFSGYILSIFGWLFLSLTLLALIGFISQGFGKGDAKGIMFCISAAVSFIIFGRNAKKSAQRYKTYMLIVINQGMTDIEYIASSISSTYEVVKKDLQKMIDKGYFEDAYINEVTGDIVLPKKEQDTVYNQSNDAAQNTEMQVIICKNCGANNSMAIGTTGECEFCGSHIEAC